MGASRTAPLRIKQSPSQRQVTDVLPWSDFPHDASHIAKQQTTTLIRHASHVKILFRILVCILVCILIRILSWGAEFNSSNLRMQAHNMDFACIESELLGSGPSAQSATVSPAKLILPAKPASPASPA